MNSNSYNVIFRLLSDQQPRISSLIKATRDLGPEEMEEEETPKSQEKSSDISQDSQGENFSSPFKAFRNNPELGQEIDLLRQEKQNLIDTLNSMQVIYVSNFNEITDSSKLIYVMVIAVTLINNVNSQVVGVQPWECGSRVRIPKLERKRYWASNPNNNKTKVRLSTE